MQVGPIKSTLKAPGSQRLKLNDEPPSNFGFKFKLRRYNERIWPGWSRLPKAASFRAGAYTCPLLSST